MSKIKIADLERAVGRAERMFGRDCWQAACLEIALLPAVYRRLKALNSGLVITRHGGETDEAMTVDERRAVSDWSRFAGYTFAAGGVEWNRVVETSYAHHPAATWTGMTRELKTHFVLDLLMVVWGLRAGKSTASIEDHLPNINAAGLELEVGL